MKAFLLFFIAMIALASYPFFIEKEGENQPKEVLGLPWQIDVLGDGTTRVFDIHIGRDTLADAIAVLGDDMELAVVVTTDVAATDKAGSLEMYYGHYRAGLLSGKLILQTDVEASVVENWQANAINTDYMATGKAKKYLLSEMDRVVALKEVISGVTFVPSVNLDEAVITARFGEADSRVEKPGVTHFLYEKKGLDIALHEKSKEVLQYVEPAAFEKLVSPLQLDTAD